ncbi:hypothetical protein HDU86_005070 [Geranomyces michiganensis]|nr:hypothetical protein HDU86_005070 [Geranomyces michiganensis]
MSALWAVLQQTENTYDEIGHDLEDLQSIDELLTGMSALWAVLQQTENTIDELLTGMSALWAVLQQTENTFNEIGHDLEDLQAMTSAHPETTPTPAFVCQLLHCGRAFATRNSLRSHTGHHIRNNPVAAAAAA